MRSIVLPAILAALSLPVPAGAYQAYLRYPDMNGNRVVFTAEDDLWLMTVPGGMPQRITSHPGSETLARFSPDGRWIAFTGWYDGNADVYLIPASGGEPRRLTWHPGPDQCIGWTPDGTRVIARSSQSNPLSWELFAIDVANGESERLPVGWASRIAIDPASGMYAFVRENVENHTWKRYRGGMAPDIWVGDPGRADYRQVTSFEGPDFFPMWHGGRVWFLSDQGGTGNIWSMKPDGSDRRQHTHETAWDVRWPAMSPDGRIVHLLAGELRVLDTGTGAMTPLPVDLPGDRVLARQRYPDAGKYITWYTLSPKADRIALVTRGEIFSVPVDKHGTTLPVTHASGARESWASYDPKGERLAYVTDASGEQAIVTADAWGRGGEKTVKAPETSGWHFPPAWSPDGAWIAWGDEDFGLWIAPASGGGTPKLADRSDFWEISEYAWSPDGRWLAYTKLLENEFRQVFVYDTVKGETRPVTTWTTDSWSPSWDPEGRYLYYLSARTMNPYLGTWRDFSDVIIRPTKIYAVLLRPDVENPYAALAGTPGHEAKDDDGKGDAARGGKGEKDDRAGTKRGSKDDAGDGADEPPKPIAITFEGIIDRTIEVPVEAGDYTMLAAAAGRLYFLDMPIKGMAEEPGLWEEPEPDGTLRMFDIAKRKTEAFASGVGSFELARRADRIAFMKKKGEIYVVDAGQAPGEDLAESKVPLDGVTLEIDPQAEWKEMYAEGWRLMRDFHWEPTHGGLDWAKVRDQYATLLPRLTTRGDLVDLMGEVIGELVNSHTYVFGGDPGKVVPQLATGLLGAELARAGDVFQVKRIYRGDPADNEPSPLLEPGVAVKEGDYILAVNHRPFAAGQPFLASLRGLADRDVVLTVNTRPSREGSRDVVAHTLSSDHELLYVDWVRRNREYVAQKTGGKVGYIHLPDMGTHGLVEFDTWYFPQSRLEGMVVDCRWNGGGFVSQRVLDRFARKIISFDRARGGAVSTYPSRALNGPFAVITNQFAGSDGDIFPYAVQSAGLAPVIGKRSWGGVVGIRGDKQLVDGGMLTQPEFAWWDTRGGWSIENHGVDPDIEIENLPQDLARGVDAQLDRSIEEVMRRHRENPPVRPVFPPAPVKTREAYAQRGR